MKAKKKDIAYLVLIVVSTAFVFFIVGAFFGDYLASLQPDTTVIQYVPASSPSSIKTTSTTSLVSSTTTVMKTTTTTESTVTTTSKETTKTKATTAVSEKININTATKEELMTITGIGEVYATRIIEYRELIGHFTCLEELLEIKGIGEKRLAKWKPFLTV